MQRYPSNSMSGAGATREFSVLVSDVDGGCFDALAIEDGNAEFTDGMRGKADSALYPAQKWQRGRLPEALVVDGSAPSGLAHGGDGFAQGCQRSCFDCSHFGSEAAT